MTDHHDEPSTELALRDEVEEIRAELEQLRAQSVPAHRQLAPMDQWVEVVRDYNLLAQALAKTDFVPKDFRGKPDQITAGLIYGREVGVPPVTMMQNMHVINGRVGMYAEHLRAMILAAGHEYDIEESTSDRCVISGRRKGSDRWIQHTYSMDQAKLSGDYSKNQNYRTRPVAMLLARASGIMAHAQFPDVIRGMGAIEELEVGEPDAPAEAEQVKAPTSTVQRAAKKTAASKRAVAAELEPPVAPPAVVDHEIPDNPVLPPLPGEEEPPESLTSPVRRRTEAEVVSEHGSAGSTPGEGPASAPEDDSPSTPAEPDTEKRQCPNISNGEQCRYEEGHLERGVRHTFGGGLKDQVSYRLCGDPGMHDSHAWVDGRTTYACSGRYEQEEPPEPEEPTSGTLAAKGKPSTLADQKLLQSRFRALGYTDEAGDREARLTVATVLAGREVESFRAGALTRDEVQAILTGLADCRGRDDVLELMVRRSQDAAAEESQA